MDTINLREYCRSWRISRGLSFKQVADYGGMSLYTVSAFEHGRTNSLRVLICYLNAGMTLREGYYEL